MDKRSSLKIKVHFRIFFNPIYSNVFDAPFLEQNSVTEENFSETISAKEDLSNWAQNSFISREIVTKHSTFNLIELWRVKDDT